MTLKAKLESVFSGEERAVSPVIGVILMVAITVILAAVIATFVLDLGGDQQQAPQASFSYSDGTITHEGGDTIPADQLSITGATVDNPFSGDVSAGSTAEVSSPSDTVRVVWNGPDGQSATLATLNP